mmetsp:Transcript_59173/g.127991  ORF Transcript_59173/g.127991 Transcript_59173/m.127991 type:complete len:212 (-) Transcript_59173:936-1571(-)
MVRKFNVCFCVFLICSCIAGSSEVRGRPFMPIRSRARSPESRSPAMIWWPMGRTKVCRFRSRPPPERKDFSMGSGAARWVTQRRFASRHFLRSSVVVTVARVSFNAVPLIVDDRSTKRSSGGSGILCLSSDRVETNLPVASFHSAHRRTGMTRESYGSSLKRGSLDIQSLGLKNWVQRFASFSAFIFAASSSSSGVSSMKSSSSTPIVNRF